MNRVQKFNFASSTISEDDLAQLFNPVVRSHYVNNMVFKAPVNRQDSMLRAIEALRQSDREVTAIPPAALPEAHG